MSRPNILAMAIKFIPFAPAIFKDIRDAASPADGFKKIMYSDLRSIDPDE